VDIVRRDPTMMMSSSINPHATHYRGVHGWATSLALHCLAGGLIFFMTERLTLAPAPELFTWNVVVQASPSPDNVKPAQAEPEVATPPSPQVTQTQPTPIEHTVAHVPVVQRSQPHVRPQPVMREEVQETRPVERPSRNVIEQAVRTPSPTVMERRTEPVNRPVEPVNEEPVVEMVSPQLFETPVERAPAQNAAPTEESLPAQHAEVVRADSRHVTENHPVVHDVRSVAEPEPVIEQTVSAQEAVPSQSSPVMAKETPQSIEKNPIEQRIVTERSSTVVHEENVIRAQTETAKLQPSVNRPTAQAFPTPQADYGWLVEALRSKVQELKRYPAIARMNNGEGRVVLRAVIKDNGEVAELEVAESSGHAALDAAALEAMRRASPLKLPHRLGRSHVVLHVPIRYHLR
jgi:periplasmic protein TonB